MLNGAASGRVNMNADTQLFDELERGIRHEPTLRLYTWKPWTVSLGQGQLVEEVIDVNILRAKGFDWVRRPTGGRAVFHAQEITYALAGPTSGPFAKAHRTHERIGKALQRFYAHFGVETQLSQPASPEDLSPKSASPCFLSPGLAEIQADGRKLAGSAQRRGRKAFLQHGSILIGPRHVQLAEFSPLPPEKQQRVRQAMLKKSACLADLINKVPPISKLQPLIAKCFAAEFLCEWE